MTLTSALFVPKHERFHAMAMAVVTLEIVGTVSVELTLDGDSSAAFRSRSRIAGVAFAFVRSRKIGAFLVRSASGLIGKLDALVYV